MKYFKVVLFNVVCLESSQDIKERYKILKNSKSTFLPRQRETTSRSSLLPINFAMRRSGSSNYFSGSYEGWSIKPGQEREMGLGPNTNFENLFERKFVQLKNFISYLQDKPVLGKYCHYGCWCFSNGEQKNIHLGYGSPIDKIDTACMQLAKCYNCAKMDHGDSCEYTNGYRFNASVVSEQGDRKLSCLDSENSCQRHLCECDRRFAERLSEEEQNWDISLHSKWSGFDPKANCQRRTFRSVEEDKDMCCGEVPERYPYSSGGGERKCCGSRTYDPLFQDCVSDKPVSL